MDHWQRIRQIEDVLARVLNRGCFEVVQRDGERLVRPHLIGPPELCELVDGQPVLLRSIAEDLERALS